MQIGDSGGATVRIGKDVYNKIVKKAQYGETVDGLVRKLLECYEKRPEVKEFINITKRLEVFYSKSPTSSTTTSGKNIRVSDETYEMLSNMGTPQISFDDIIQVLLKDSMNKNSDIKDLMNVVKKLKVGQSRMRPEDTTTIRLHMKTYNQITSMGTTKMSINDILNRIFEVCEEKK